MGDFGGLSKHSVNGAECVGNGYVKQVHRVVGLDRLCNGWCGGRLFAAGLVNDNEPKA